MSTHVALSPNEAADRLSIRELVEAYAHCADRRRLAEAKAPESETQGSNDTSTRRI